MLSKLKEYFSYRGTPYIQLGGQRGIQQLVDDFYKQMDSLEQARECRELHPESLKDANEKLFMFLSGWLGGPSLYQEKYGHPRLRMRHMPFKISGKEKEQWMLCMKIVLKDTKIKSDLEVKLLQAFDSLATKMINSA